MSGMFYSAFLKFQIEPVIYHSNPEGKYFLVAYSRKKYEQPDLCDSFVPVLIFHKLVRLYLRIILSQDLLTNRD